MALRTFNTCSGINLLGKYEIEGGINLYVSDGKSSRNICSCGWVGKEDTCPICGNTSWKYVSNNNWSKRSEPINVAVGTLEIENCSGDKAIVNVPILVIHETSSYQLELYEIVEVAAQLSINNLSLISNPRASIGGIIDVTNFIVEAYEQIASKELRDYVAHCITVSKCIWGNEDNLWKASTVMTMNGMKEVLTEENMKKYRRFFTTIFQRTDWLRKTLPGHKIKNMEDLWEAINLPCEYAAYYASSKFSFGHYYYGNVEIDSAKLHALDDNLQLAIKNCLLHNIISLSSIRSIVEWSPNSTHEMQKILAKFMRKHGMMFQGWTFERFLEIYQRANGVEELVLNPKRLAIEEANSMLDRRGFPESRRTAFVDVFDIKPDIGFELLTSKAQLKKDEAAKIYK